MTTYHWLGRTARLNFGQAHNWSPGGGPPGATDIAEFGGLNSTVNGSATIGMLLFDAPTSLQFTGAIDAVGISGGNAVHLGAGAEVTFDAGASLTAATKLEVGLFSGTSSSLHMIDAALTTSNAAIGVEAGAYGLVGITEGLWLNARGLVIGSAGHGAVSVDGGAELIVGTSMHPAQGSVALGAAAGSTGVLSVSDDSAMIIEGALDIGGAPGAATHGLAQVSVSNGGDIYTQGSISVAAGSSVSLADGYFNGSDMTIAAGASLFGTGSAGVQNGLHNNGAITAAGGFLSLGGMIDGTGTIGIATGASLALPESVAQGSISFLGADGTLDLPQFTLISAPIGGFVTGDHIFGQYADSVSFNPADNVLTLLSAGTSEGKLTLSGDYSNASFSDHYTGSTGDITVLFTPHG